MVVRSLFSRYLLVPFRVVATVEGAIPPVVVPTVERESGEGRERDDENDDEGDAEGGIQDDQEEASGRRASSKDGEAKKRWREEGDRV